jgi:hypothetical protein
MAVNTAKRKQAIEKADRLMKGDERVLSHDTYQRDLMYMLNYYNSNNDDKDKKKWFISHYAKTDKKAAVEFLKVDEYHFRHAGILARLMDIGSELQEKEQNYFNERVEFLKSQITKRQKSQDKQDIKDAAAAKAALPSNVISIQQRMEDKAHELAGEIEGAIDDFVLNDCKSDFSTKNYLLANQVAGPIAKRIGEFYVDRLMEISAAIEGEDDQLVEGYSNFNKRELKRFATFIEIIIADCNQMVQTAKANRAPRKRKEVSPAKLVAKMKYMKDFAELNLKSIQPSTIIGSSEVWFYNTKYRRVGVYKAEGTTLSVKGTTIIGFDIKESKAFTLRKPEEFFKGLSMGKRALNSAMKTLKTKPSQPNGRINEECILLGAF